MDAPAEPALARLTPTRVEMLVEHYVRFLVETKNGLYYGALPGAFVTALMQYSPSRIPIVRAINTAPLVTMSGQIIYGVGLDRNTGLFHQIDPVLRSCIPQHPPTEADVRDALNFLLNEWLVDVALDPVGKCIAVMLAMTLIQRGLLPERPAFFVNAPQRGGGKTTLVSMIVMAVLGRRAAAAAWSDSREERKKALFSYLRQSVACVVWDNIGRGAAISCPHIEAALTASEISDRVLGVSRVETVPSTTVQIFTGNSITPRGDMASRSLMLALNVDRPDPENRTFVHADPLGWTEANRATIVRSLYTLLIAGALNRPETQEAKTRFKTWWNSVGWAMEYGAALIAITVNCTELMRAGEVGDEEATAASVVLTVLREIWGDDAFTAKQVVEAMTSEHADDQAKAESIANALEGLDGKRLDRPTAHSIGKLFQKRLVGRPAWIRDGQAVAILKRSPGHNANTYQIHQSGSGQEFAAGSSSDHSFSDPRQTHSQDSPHSPRRDPKDDGLGKEGKDFREDGAISPNAKRAAPGWSGRL
ncbi:MAG: hypothetical protein ACLQFW_19120 [Xanthobacteraceae bacterium]